MAEKVWNEMIGFLFITLLLDRWKILSEVIFHSSGCLSRDAPRIHIVTVCFNIFLLVRRGTYSYILLSISVRQYILLREEGTSYS